MRLKLAKYEWVDSTGMRGPSLVVVKDDSTDDPKTMEIMRVKRIWTIAEYFDNGRLKKRRLPRIPGYRFQWFQKYMEPVDMENAWYALVLGYVKKEEDENEHD